MANNQDKPQYTIFASSGAWDLRGEEISNIEFPFFIGNNLHISLAEREPYLDFSYETIYPTEFQIGLNRYFDEDSGNKVYYPEDRDLGLQTAPLSYEEYRDEENKNLIFGDIQADGTYEPFFLYDYLEVPVYAESFNLYLYSQGEGSFNGIGAFDYGGFKYKGSKVSLYEGLQTPVFLYEDKFDEAESVDFSSEDVFNETSEVKGKTSYLAFDYEFIDQNKLNYDRNLYVEQPIEPFEDLDDFCLVSTDSELIRCQFVLTESGREAIVFSSRNEFNVTGENELGDHPLSREGQFTYKSHFYPEDLSKKPGFVGIEGVFTNTFGTFDVVVSNQGNVETWTYEPPNILNKPVLEKYSPTAVYDRSRGRIVLAFTSCSNIDSSVVHHIYESYDKGLTWNKVTKVPSKLKYDPYTEYFKSEEIAKSAKKRWWDNVSVYDSVYAGKGGYPDVLAGIDDKIIDATYLRDIRYTQSKTRICLDEDNPDRIILVAASKFQMAINTVVGLDLELFADKIIAINGPIFGDELKWYRYMEAIVSEDGGTTWNTKGSRDTVTSNLSFEQAIDNIQQVVSPEKYNLFNLFDNNDIAHFYHDWKYSWWDDGQFSKKTRERNLNVGIDKTEVNTPYFGLYYDKDVKNFVIVKGVQRAEWGLPLKGEAEKSSFEEQRSYRAEYSKFASRATLSGTGSFIERYDIALENEFPHCNYGLTNLIDAANEYPVEVSLKLNERYKYWTRNAPIIKSYLKAITPKSRDSRDWKRLFSKDLALDACGIPKTIYGDALSCNIGTTNSERLDLKFLPAPDGVPSTYNLKPFLLFQQPVEEGVRVYGELYGDSLGIENKLHEQAYLYNTMWFKISKKDDPGNTQSGFAPLFDVSLWYQETSKSSNYFIKNCEVVASPGEENFLTYEVVSRKVEFRPISETDFVGFEPSFKYYSSNIVKLRSMDRATNWYFADVKVDLEKQVGEDCQISAYETIVEEPTIKVLTSKVIRDVGITPLKAYSKKANSVFSEYELLQNAEDNYNESDDSFFFMFGSFDLRRQSIAPSVMRNAYFGYWGSDPIIRYNVDGTIYSDGNYDLDFQSLYQLNGPRTHDSNPVRLGDVVLHMDEIHMHAKTSGLDKESSETSLTTACVSKRWNSFLDASPYEDVLVFDKNFGSTKRPTILGGGLDYVLTGYPVKELANGTTLPAPYRIYTDVSISNYKTGVTGDYLVGNGFDFSNIFATSPITDKRVAILGNERDLDWSDTPSPLQKLSEGGVRPLLVVSSDTKKSMFYKYGLHEPPYIKRVASAGGDASYADPYAKYAHTCMYHYDADPFTGFFKAHFKVAGWPDTALEQPGDTASAKLLQYQVVKRTTEENTNVTNNQSPNIPEGNPVYYGSSHYLQRSGQKFRKEDFTLGYKFERGGELTFFVLRGNQVVFDKDISSEFIDTIWENEIASGQLPQIEFKVFTKLSEAESASDVSGNHLVVWYRFIDNRGNKWRKLGEKRNFVSEATDYIGRVKYRQTGQSPSLYNMSILDLGDEDGFTTYSFQEESTSADIPILYPHTNNSYSTTIRDSLRTHSLPVVYFGASPIEESIIDTNGISTYPIPSNTKDIIHMYYFFKHSWGQYGDDKDYVQGYYTPSYDVKIYGGSYISKNSESYTSFSTRMGCPLPRNQTWKGDYLKQSRLKYEGMDKGTLQEAYDSVRELGRSCSSGVVVKSIRTEFKSLDTAEYVDPSICIPKILDFNGLMVNQTNTIAVSRFKGTLHPEDIPYSGYMQQAIRKYTSLLEDFETAQPTTYGHQDFKYTFYNTRNLPYDKVFFINCIWTDFTLQSNYGTLTKSNIDQKFKVGSFNPSSSDQFMITFNQELDQEYRDFDLFNFFGVWENSNGKELYLKLKVQDIEISKSETTLFIEPSQSEIPYNFSRVEITPKSFYLDVPYPDEYCQITFEGGKIVDAPMKIGNIVFAQKLSASDFIESVSQSTLEFDLETDTKARIQPEENKPDANSFSITLFTPYTLGIGNSTQLKEIISCAKNDSRVILLEEGTGRIFYCSFDFSSYETNQPISINDDSIQLALKET